MRSSQHRIAVIANLIRVLGFLQSERHPDILASEDDQLSASRCLQNSWDLFEWLKRILMHRHSSSATASSKGMSRDNTTAQKTRN